MSIFRSRHFNNMEKVKEYINNPIYLMDKKYEDNQRYNPNPIEIILSLPLGQLDSNLLVGEKNQKIFESLSIPEQEALEYMLELKEEEKRYHQEYGYHRMFPKRKADYINELKELRKEKIDNKYAELYQYYKDSVINKKNRDVRQGIRKRLRIKGIIPPVRFADDDNIEKIQEIPNSDKLEEQYKQSDERYDMEEEDRRIRGGKYKKKTRKTNKKKTKKIYKKKTRKPNTKYRIKKYNKSTRKTI